MEISPLNSVDPIPGFRTDRHNTAKVMRALIATSILLGITGTASAERQTLSQWNSGAWNVALVNDTRWNQKSCIVWTGGDGTGILRMHISHGGGDASFGYTPVAFSNVPSPLYNAVSVLVVVDGYIMSVGSDMEIGTSQNEWNEPETYASVSNTNVSNVVEAFRLGDQVDMGGAETGQIAIFDSYSLSGFTANWLKAAEWCAFQPDKVFVNNS